MSRNELIKEDLGSSSPVGTREEAFRKHGALDDFLDKIEVALSSCMTSQDSPHTFTIDELGINVAVDGRKTVTQQIKIDKAGTFTFYCAVPGHRSAGMEGTIKVTE